METLVLDMGFAPMALVPWRRAVTLLFEGKVEVVEAYRDRVVRSVTLEVKVPAVIRFLRSRRARKRGIRFSRENVWARDGGRCQYCQAKVPRHDFTYDHVTPRALQGPTRWENVVVCCMACNQRKGGRTPEQAGMRLLAVPVRPRTLKGTARYTLTYQPGMPEPWRAWLRDVSYWHGELDNDD